MEKKEQTFEEALGQLDAIVKKLEKPDLPLDESIRLFEQGMSLSTVCTEKLDQAQQRVEVLLKQPAGAPKVVPFKEKGRKQEEPDEEEPSGEEPEL